MDTSYFNINGELFPCEQAALSVTNRAFKYGDGLFESIRVKNGKPLFVADHYRRLCSGIKLLKMIAPPNFTEEYLSQEISRLLKGNKVRKGARVRLNVFRDSPGYYTPEKDDLAWVMEVEELPDNAYTLNEKGLTIGIYKERRIVPDCFSTIKSVSRVPYVLSGIYAREKGWDDCLLENSQGSIMEAVSSNLFLLMGSTYYTPPVADGCLPGVMRSKLIELIQKKGGTVIENSIKSAHLERVDEVFLTNSISGIKWVGAFEQKRYFHNKSSELIEALNALTD